MIVFFAQAEAITQQGSISANWVLVGVTSIACLLFWRMLSKIESNVEKLLSKSSTQQTKLELHDKAIEDLEDEVFELRKEHKLSRR